MGFLRTTAMALVGAVTVTGSAHAQAAPAPPPAQGAVVGGQPFPASTFVNLNSGAGGPAKIDLRTYLGKQPIVLVYWMSSFARSQMTLVDVQTWAEGLGAGKVAVFGVAAPAFGSTDTAPIKAKIQELKLKVPVLLDEGFRLVQQLNVRSVPAIAIIDAKGILRLSNAGSLKQTVEYKMTVADALKRVAATGQLGTYGELPRYEPIVEWIGKKPPEFELPASDGVPRRWESLLASDKINVVIFWAVDCPHCKHFIPLFNTWLKGHGDGINVISVSKVMNDAMRTQTTEFVRLNGLSFPTLFDDGFKVADRFGVIATPTILIVRPDGVADSLMPASETDFDTYFGAKKKTILKRG